MASETVDDEKKRIVERFRLVGEMTRHDKSNLLRELQEMAKKKSGRLLTSREIHERYGPSESWIRKYMPTETRAKPNMARYKWNNPQIRKKDLSLATGTGIRVRCNECAVELELIHLGSGHKVEPITDDRSSQAS